MFIGILSITSAILLSIISMVFSITGIITIFSGAAIGAGIMGGVLEFSKISATVWLYSFWKKANTILKTYFIIAIIILITISTIGIYGYLSRAYVGQGESTQKVKTEIEFTHQSIANEQNNMARAQEQIDKMNENFSQLLEGNFITRGLEMRENYEDERQQLVKRINESRVKISEYQDKLFDLQQQLNTLEVNVGPVKYIAILLYGEDNAEQFYDNAARILIILIVIVFDPFAVLLMVAGNIAIDTKNTVKKNKTKSTTKKKTVPKPKKKPEPTKEEIPDEEILFEDTSQEKPSLPQETPPKIHKRRKVVKK